MDLYWTSRLKSLDMEGTEAITYASLMEVKVLSALLSVVCHRLMS